jgi:protein BCP1
MDEKFFHGLKTHLLSQIAYAPFSSSLADLMIENISVGTVVSTSDGEDNVYGFASVLNVTSYNDQQCIQDLKQLCLKNCPNAHRSDVETVLSGKTKRPAGFFIHGRMVNLPLEITLVLHEQLVLDMDWAVKHADGGEEERKSLDFGAFVLLAPCYLDSTTKQIVYNNFDDEIFAGCAEFTYTMELKKTSFFDSNNGNGNGKESSLVNVIVLTKTGHREGMKELKKLVAG